MVLLVFLGFLLGGLFYSRMPEKMVSGWDYLGQPNSYLSRFWGLFLSPIIALIMLGLFWLIPRIDPLRENIKKFRSPFDGFIVLILLFLLYLHLLVLAWNLGWRFNLIYFMVLPFAILLWLTGSLLEKTKRNWFIGVKTPWTISSDLVWQKTHSLGGLLFKISGLIALGGFFLPDLGFWLVIVPVLLSAIFLTIYSYFCYKKEVNNAQK